MPNERLAERLRGFGPLGLLAVAFVLGGNFLFVPLSAVLALVWARLSHTPWRDLGFVRSKSWSATLAVGIVFGAGFKLSMKMVVMPLLGAPAVNQAFHYLVGNRAAIPDALYLVLIGAAFGEETIFRGYAFERLTKLLGRSAWAQTLMVLLTTAWFGLAHYRFQGLPGVQQATIVGLVFAIIFAFTRQLWLLIFAHAAFDITAVAIIYFDLEEKFAHAIFQ